MNSYSVLPFPVPERWCLFLTWLVRVKAGDCGSTWIKELMTPQSTYGHLNKRS